MNVTDHDSSLLLSTQCVDRGGFLRRSGTNATTSNDRLLISRVFPSTEHYHLPARALTLMYDSSGEADSHDFMLGKICIYHPCLLIFLITGMARPSQSTTTGSSSAASSSFISCEELAPPLCNYT
jgi:hypothetical protein